MHSDRTDSPLTYHIRGTSLELYIHRTTLNVSVQCFVSQNEIIHPICNIWTYSPLLLAKAQISELQECLGKFIPPLEFISFYTIVILVWNEWFGWIHTIWIWNGYTSLLLLLLLFCGFIFPCTSQIIWLLRSCHIYHVLFFHYIWPPYPYPCCVLLVYG